MGPENVPLPLSRIHEDLPALSSRPKGEISSRHQISSPVLVVMTDGRVFCCRICGKIPTKVISSAARNLRGKECALASTTPLPWCDRSHAPAWECSPGRSSSLMPTRVAWVASPNWRVAAPHPLSPCGRGILFFACPKKRNKRKGSPAAETAPFAKVRNRRGNNSLRSNSLPLHPVPRLAARRSANGPHRARIPLNETSRNPAGRTSVATESRVDWVRNEPQQKQAIGSARSPSCHLGQRERSSASRDFSSRCSSKRQTREEFAPKFTAYARPLVI